MENKKEFSHIYELGGGRLLKNLVAVSLNRENLKNAMYIIVLDLSQPGNVLDSLVFWFDAIREHVKICLHTKIINKNGINDTIKY